MLFRYLDNLEFLEFELFIVLYLLSLLVNLFGFGYGLLLGVEDLLLLFLGREVRVCDDLVFQILLDSFALFENHSLFTFSRFLDLGFSFFLRNKRIKEYSARASAYGYCDLVSLPCLLYLSELGESEYF